MWTAGTVPWGLQGAPACLYLTSDLRLQRWGELIYMGSSWFVVLGGPWEMSTWATSPSLTGLSRRLPGGPEHSPHQARARSCRHNSPHRPSSGLRSCLQGRRHSR